MKTTKDDEKLLGRQVLNKSFNSLVINPLNI